jgi:hypothetical protein
MSDASKHVEAMIVAYERGSGYTVTAATLRLLLKSINELERERDALLAQALRPCPCKPKEQNNEQV